jgi:CHASE3 domain sensor protein
MDMNAQAPGSFNLVSAYRRGQLRGLGAPITLGALVMLVSGMLLLSANISGLRENLTWVRHAEYVIQQISAAEAGIVGDELTVRSYALTGDKNFLLYQRSERRRLSEAMTRLAAATASDVSDSRAYRQIQTLVRQHMDMYGRLTGMGPDHAQVVAKAITDPGNRRIMLTARARLADFREDLERRLADHQETITQEAAHAFRLAVGIIIAAFLLAGLGVSLSLERRG